MKAVTALLAPLLLAGCAAPSTSSPAGPATALMRPDPLHGYDVADRNCSLCHAIRPAAASPHPRAPAFTAFARDYPLDRLASRLATGDVVGHKGMPQIELDRRQIDDLIAYIRSLYGSASSR